MARRRLSLWVHELVLRGPLQRVFRRQGEAGSTGRLVFRVILSFFVADCSGHAVLPTRSVDADTVNQPNMKQNGVAEHGAVLFLHRCGHGWFKTKRGFSPVSA
jgi:hypothetical protein